MPLRNGHYAMPENVMAVPSPPELPEVEGFFRYLGKKMHFVGHIDAEEDDLNNTQ